ncbi:hypothetical protein [Microcoleus sp. herbarium14]
MRGSLMQMVDRFLYGKFWAVAIPQRSIALLVTSVLVAKGDRPTHM